MNKKIVVFGGGHGANYFLQGIKNLPLDITAIIAVSDNGRSTGKLREEFNMPAMGDLRNVIISLANIDEEMKEALQYRFDTYSDLDGHPLGNLILASLYNNTGSLKKASELFSNLLNIKHKVLPLSEEYLTLIGKTTDNKIIEGEANIAKANKQYKKIYYRGKPLVLPEVLLAIKEADAIIFSMGSLYTSIIPHLLCPQVIRTLKESKAPKIYICNAVTQPGETFGFTASDHIKTLNTYLKYSKIDVVLASNSNISQEIIDKYTNQENKDLVKIDKEEIAKLGCELIVGDLLKIENGMIRHDCLKLAAILFSYLMR